MTESMLKPDLWALNFTQLTLFMEKLSDEIRYHAGQGASDEQWADTQAFKVMEEVGEFCGEWNRLKGFCRRAGNKDALIKELADVIVASFIMFAVLDEDAEMHIKAKLHEVITRGYVNKDAAQSAR